jgi:hypothetical protein
MWQIAAMEAECAQVVSVVIISMIHAAGRKAGGIFSVFCMV